MKLLLTLAVLSVTTLAYAEEQGPFDAFEGNYKVESHTLNKASCEPSEKPAETTFSFFKFTEEELLGIPFLSFDECSSATECDEELFNISYYFDNAEEGRVFGEPTAAVSGTAGECLLSITTNEAFFDTEDQLHLEKYQLSGYVPALPDKTCTEEGSLEQLRDMYRHSEFLSCSRLEIIKATKIAGRVSYFSKTVSSPQPARERAHYLESTGGYASTRGQGAINLYATPAVLSDDTVVVGGIDGKLFWIKDGELLYEFETEGAIRQTPVVLADDTIVVGSIDHHVYWLKDGELITKFQGRGGYWAPFAVVDNGVVVAITWDGDMSWLKDGKELHHYKMKNRWGYNFSNALSVLSDNTVVFGENRLVSWVKDGNLQFQVEIEERPEHGSPLLSSAPLVLPNDEVVVTAYNDAVHWLKDGNVLRSDYAASDVGSSPTLSASGNVLVGGKYRIYEYRDRQLIKTFDLPISSRYAASILVLNDGAVLARGTVGVNIFVDGKLEPSHPYVPQAHCRMSISAADNPPAVLSDGRFVCNHDSGISWYDWSKE